MDDSLYDQATSERYQERIRGIAADTAPAWGKMSAAQMFGHCAKPLAVALGDETLSCPFVLRLIGPLIRKGVLSPRPFKQNLPTARSFLVPDPEDCETQREQLIGQLCRFRDARESVATRPHPFFGKLDAAQWDALMRKHLDHHLRQFGV